MIYQTMQLIISEIQENGHTLYRTESGTIYDKDFNIKFENKVKESKHIQLNHTKNKEIDTIINELSKNFIMSYNVTEVFHSFLGDLFEHISGDFSGKEFTKEDLLTMYLKIDHTTFLNNSINNCICIFQVP